MSFSSSLLLPISIFLLLVGPTLAHGPHVITIRSPNLFPESLAWDPSSQHFVVGSFRHASLHSVSDAGVLQTLVSSSLLPPNSSVLGVTIDTVHRRLLAVIHTVHLSPPFNALASYDLSRPSPHPRLFLAPLSDPTADRPIANDVTVDLLGNAYVTNSVSNFIWKIDINGQDSIFSNSSVFRSHPIYADRPDSWCGLNGIAHIRKGYILAVQSNTGKIYKIDDEDGAARRVLIPKDLTGADGIAIRSDGTVVVVAPKTAWFLKSDDGWAEAVVYDEIALEVGRFSTAVAIREGKRAYLLYGHMDEGILGNVERMEFSIEELESEREREGENVWMFVLIGFGFAYFLYWRFQMGNLVKEMNKKRE